MTLISDGLDLMWIIKFYSFNLDLNRMMLILEFDLNVVNTCIYVPMENEVPSFTASKVTA